MNNENLARREPKDLSIGGHISIGRRGRLPGIHWARLGLDIKTPFSWLGASKLLGHLGQGAQLTKGLWGHWGQHNTLATGFLHSTPGDQKKLPVIYREENTLGSGTDMDRDESSPEAYIRKASGVSLRGEFARNTLPLGGATQPARNLGERGRPKGA